MIRGEIFVPQRLQSRELAVRAALAMKGAPPDPGVVVLERATHHEVRVHTRAELVEMLEALAEKFQADPGERTFYLDARAVALSDRSAIPVFVHADNGDKSLELMKRPIPDYLAPPAGEA